MDALVVSTLASAMTKSLTAFREQAHQHAADSDQTDDGAEQLTPEMTSTLLEATKGVDADQKSVRLKPAEAGAALTLAPDVFKRARQRISLTFQVRLALAIALGAVLVGGIVGCIVAGLFGRSTWALAFGGISVADLLGFAFTKPLAAITEVVVASQRLELLHLRLTAEMESCRELDDPHERIACQTVAWENAEHSLQSMSS